MKKLYVGNLAYATTNEGLRAFFADYSPVSVKIITDQFSGQSRGFGFVEIEDSETANNAIRDLNGKMLDGKTLTINEARPQTGGGSGGSYGKPRPSGGGDRRSSSGYSGRSYH